MKWFFYYICNRCLSINKLKLRTSLYTQREFCSHCDSIEFMFHRQHIHTLNLRDIVNSTYSSLRLKKQAQRLLNLNRAASNLEY